MSDSSALKPFASGTYDASEKPTSSPREGSSMISSFTSTFVMRLAAIAPRGLTAQRRLAALLLTTTALLLALAGSASAGGLWAPITLNAANWSGNAGFGTVAPAAYLDSQGLVHLQGAVTQTSQSGNLNFIGTVPFGDRPNRVVYTIVHTFNGTYADLSIGTNGQIFLIPSSATGRQFVSLEGITYQPGNANPVTPISLNTANWSGNVCCGASAPGAYVTDANGIFSVVHLQGAVTQTSSSGSNPDFVGTLPFIPNTGTGGPPEQRTVYTIVHTFGGTYADLAINDSGQIFLLPLTGTLTQSDTRFVSLEGISFPIGFETSGINPDPNPGWDGGCCGALPEIEALEDHEGFIHLVGAVSQTLCCTPIVTLPGSQALAEPVLRGSDIRGNVRGSVDRDQRHDQRHPGTVSKTIEPVVPLAGRHHLRRTLAQVLRAARTRHREPGGDGPSDPTQTADARVARASRAQPPARHPWRGAPRHPSGRAVAHRLEPPGQPAIAADRQLRREPARAQRKATVRASAARGPHTCRARQPQRPREAIATRHS